MSNLFPYPYIIFQIMRKYTQKPRAMQMNLFNFALPGRNSISDRKVKYMKTSCMDEKFSENIIQPKGDDIIAVPPVQGKAYLAAENEVVVEGYFSPYACAHVERFAVSAV